MWGSGSRSCRRFKSRSVTEPNVPHSTRPKSTAVASRRAGSQGQHLLPTVIVGDVIVDRGESMAPSRAENRAEQTETLLVSKS
jgi:hypothetical protein